MEISSLCAIGFSEDPSLFSAPQTFLCFNHRSQMTKKYHMRPGILDFISRRERGLLLNSQYKGSVTHVKVGRLPKFSEISKYEIDGFVFFSLRKTASGDFIGPGFDATVGTSSSIDTLYVLQFKTVNSADSIAIRPFLYGIPLRIFGTDMDISVTADLSSKNPKSVLIAGNTRSDVGVAVLASYHRDFAHPEHSWRVDDRIVCGAGDINSENFVLGCKGGFYVCKNLRLNRKYDIQSSVWAAEFNNNGNFFYISDHNNGIRLCDMREDLEESLRNSTPYIKEAAVCDRPFCATRMKLLSDQVTLVAADRTDHISKIDLRMRRPMFQYSEQRCRFFTRCLSIDEELDLLCTVEHDDYCRIWSLSSGKLHWSLPVGPTNFPTDENRAHACIVSKERRWFVVVVQKGTATPFFPDSRDGDRCMMWRL